MHGATFPSALSIAHRFDGFSWRNSSNEAGFDVWGLDFQGFGCSDRYEEMERPADASAPLCNAQDGGEQVEAAARFILERQGLSRLSLVSHSWGSMPAGRLAGKHPAMIDRWVLFGPISAARRRYEAAPSGQAWKIVTVQDQWDRFVEDVPPGEPPVLSRRHFDDWSERYLDSDSASRARDPVGVKVPLGPFIDILHAWHGELGYDPSVGEGPGRFDQRRMGRLDPR